MNAPGMVMMPYDHSDDHSETHSGQHSALGAGEFRDARKGAQYMAFNLEICRQLFLSKPRAHLKRCTSAAQTIKRSRSPRKISGSAKWPPIASKEDISMRMSEKLRELRFSSCCLFKKSSEVLHLNKVAKDFDSKRFKDEDGGWQESGGNRGRPDA